MKKRLGLKRPLAVAVAVVSLVAVSAAGQTKQAAPSKPAARGRAAWTAPRTPDGQPDLQGVWSQNTITPLQRPAAWADKQFLTDAEVEALKKATANALDGDGDAVFGDALVLAAIANEKGKSFEPSTGNYNHFWLVDRDFDNRTSLVVDPPDGRIPALTPEAQKKSEAAAEARRLRPADGPEDRSLSERCITFGVPRILAGYNSYYQILQSPGYVVISMETIHDARIIPLDRRPHVSPNVRLWLGDSRGHWEGETLVIDTTNFSPKSNFMGSTENLHLVERLTRIGPDTIAYEITVSDPTTWTKPWTAMIPLKRTLEQMYEYACHEGNTGMEGILSGHRTQEQADQARR